MKTNQIVEASPENIQKLQAALERADGLAHEAHRAISALVEAIGVLLLQPDTGARREAVSTLAEQIDHRAFEASNEINAEAESLGCNYIDEKQRFTIDRMYAAARTTHLN